MATPRRLYKSGTNKLLAGVCGGFADYFNIDPTLMRLIWILLGIFTGGIFVLLYIILAIIMPTQGSTATAPEDVIRENIRTFPSEAEQAGRRIGDAVSGRQPPSGEPTSPSPPPATPVPPPHTHEESRRMWAIILIAIGVIFLLINFAPFGWFTWGRLWPILLIVIGVAILLARARRG